MSFLYTHQRNYKGVGITNGKVRGRVRFLEETPVIKKSIKRRSPKNELERVNEAIKATTHQIKGLERRARETLGEEESGIFEIHSMLLYDQDFYDTICEEITNGKSAEEAVKSSGEKYARVLSELNDEYLSARANDIRDVASQLIEALLGEKIEKSKENEPYILVANDLTPSQTVKLDKEKILGFITFGGTPSSHTAILARAMGIPALVGVGAIPNEFNGEVALLDSTRGEVTFSPTLEEMESFESERKRENKIAKEHERYLRSVMNKPAVTRSGHKIMIYANIGDENEINGALSNGAEGIGLLRSEFLYLSTITYPSEEMLFSAYRDIASEMEGRRVVIRTLDVGADKQISYFNLEKEENPALGYRGVRITLDRRELFKTQLRAILRASSYGRISIMVPMIISLDEVRECKSILEECKTELRGDKIPFDEKIEFGIMIETPASAIMSDILATEVDFFSVGTNDLCQYTLAVDRQNPRVSHLIESNLEPVMRLIKKASDAIHQNGGWIGVCGEMAADLSLTKHFASMQVDELSVSVPYLLGVRGKVSECK